MPLTRIDSAFLDLDAIGGIDFDVQSGVPTLSVDATTHRVGIGTDTPTAKLHVVGGGKLEGNYEITNRFEFQSGDGRLSYGSFWAEDDMSIYGKYDTHLGLVTNPATGSGFVGGIVIESTANRFQHPEVITLNAKTVINGDVGIGTASPAYQLDVKNPTTPGESWVRVDTATATNDCGYRFAHGGTNHFVIGHDGTDDCLQFYDNVANTERMRIDSSGRLMVGTTTEQTARLVVSGSAGSGDDGINVISGSTTVGSKSGIFFSPSTTGSTTTGSAIKSERLSPDGSDLQFYTCTALGNTSIERVRIGKSGNVGIGTNNPVVLLDIRRSSTTAYSSSATTNDTSFLLINTGGGGHATVQLQSVSSGTAQTGQATITATNESASSKNTALIFGTRQNSDSTVRERLRIDSAGELSISGSRSGLNVSDAVLKFNIVNSNGDSKKAEIKAIKTADITSELIFSTTVSHAFDERMRIGSTGNVGIGTNNPQDPLHIERAGDFKLKLHSTGNSNVGLRLWSTKDWIIQSGPAAGDGLRFYDETTGGLGEVLRLDNKGNVSAMKSFSSSDISFGQTLNNLPGTGNEIRRLYRYSTSKVAAISTYEGVFKISHSGTSNRAATFIIGGNTFNQVSTGGNVGHSYTKFAYTVGNGSTPRLNVLETVVDANNYNSGFCEPILVNNEVYIFIKSNSTSSSGRLDVQDIYLDVITNDFSTYTIQSISGTPSSLSISDPNTVTNYKIFNTIETTGGLYSIGTSSTNRTGLVLRNNHGDGSNQGSVDLLMDVIASTGQYARSAIRSEESTSDAPYSQLSFWTSNTTSITPLRRVTINKDGNVGIGTDNPGNKLQVHGNTVVNSGHLEVNTSNSSRGYTKYRVVTGYKLFGTTSGTWTDIARVGHSHALELTYMVVQNDNYAFGGAHGTSLINTRYGSSSSEQVLHKNVGAMNGGEITGFEWRYLNSGGSYSYILQARVTFTGTTNGAFSMGYSIKGHSSDTIIPL